jgi:protein-disulfide isomerase
MSQPEIPGVVEAALSAADHSLGDAHAHLTLLEYGDYACPACIAAEPRTRWLIERHGRQLRFIFRHCPQLESHPQAELAAEAAEAAAAQGQFWAMHHALFNPPHHLAPADLRARAQAIGLDMIRFDAEMGDRIYTQRVQEHRRAAEFSGVRTTPAFFLNGRSVDVTDGFALLEQAIQTLQAGR